MILANIYDFMSITMNLSVHLFPHSSAGTLPIIKLLETVHYNTGGLHQAVNCIPDQKLNMLKYGESTCY